MVVLLYSIVSVISQIIKMRRLQKYLHLEQNASHLIIYWNIANVSIPQAVVCADWW